MRICRITNNTKLSLSYETAQIRIIIFAEMKDAFDLFDKTGDKRIDVKELGMVLRSLGQNPTDKHVEDVMKQADKDGKLIQQPY